MKKIALAGLIAITMIALSQQHASAWVNSRFGIGLNWSMQSGGNNFLWGGYRNGQPPAPEAFGGTQRQGGDMPFFGSAPTPQYFAPMPQGYPAHESINASFAQPQYASPYQFANYPRPMYYYPAPAYYYYSYDR